MVVAWIVITLMIAIVAGAIMANISGRHERGTGFVIGFIFTCNVSFWIGAVYVVAHFVGKYW